MKRKGHMFNDIVEFNNLIKAAMRASRGKKDRREVISFCLKLETELLDLKNDLMMKRYRPGPLTTFMIRDPKERLISAPTFRDRVLHHAVINVIGPIMEKRFIYHSYACREGKGMHRAVRYAQKCSRKNPFFLKTDVKSYFHSIDHEVLKEILNSIFKDPDLIWLLDTIIDGDGEKEVGLPIGSLTSQWFANLYLDVLDHHLKDDLGIRSYVRYMDDMLVFGEDKDQIHNVKYQMKEFLEMKLHLKLKEKVTMIGPVTEGIPFLGLMIYPNLIRIRGPNKRRSLKRLKIRMKQFDRGDISEDDLSRSISSITEHLKIGNTYRLRRDIFRDMFP